MYEVIFVHHLAKQSLGAGGGERAFLEDLSIFHLIHDLENVSHAAWAVFLKPKHQLHLIINIYLAHLSNEHLTIGEEKFCQGKQMLVCIIYGNLCIDYS